MTIRNLMLSGGKIATPVEGDIPANAIPGGGYWTGVRLYNNDSAFLACKYDESITRRSVNIWG